MKIEETEEKFSFDSCAMPCHSFVYGSPVACWDSINLFCVSLRVHSSGKYGLLLNMFYCVLNLSRVQIAVRVGQ